MILTSADSAAAATAAKVVESSTSTEQQQPKENDTKVGLDLLGPAGTQGFLHSLRHFMRRGKFPIVIQEGAVANHKCAPSVTTHKRNKKKKKQSSEQDFQYSVESLVFYETVLDRHEHSNNGRKRPRSRQRQVLSFCFTSAPIPGKFLPHKAAELGVPKGPLFAELKSGQSVTFTNDDGVEKTVESHQVVTPPSPGAAVLVLYYPTVEIGKQVFASDKLRHVVESNDVCVDAVFHLAPESVFAATLCSALDSQWQRHRRWRRVDHSD